MQASKVPDDPDPASRRETGGSNPNIGYSFDRATSLTMSPAYELQTTRQARSGPPKFQYDGRLLCGETGAGPDRTANRGWRAKRSKKTTKKGGSTNRAKKKKTDDARSTPQRTWTPVMGWVTCFVSPGVEPAQGHSQRVFPV